MVDDPRCAGLRSRPFHDDYACVPIRVELRTERGDAVRNLSDPSGGTFDAAGDFDRLLGGTDGLLRYVDPYGDTVFNGIQAADLVGEIERLATSDNVTDLERRGLDRLRVMAERCRDAVHLYIWFIGD
jgi:hypothetical protein